MRTKFLTVRVVRHRHTSRGAVAAPSLEIQGPVGWGSEQPDVV